MDALVNTKDRTSGMFTGMIFKYVSLKDGPLNVYRYDISLKNQTSRMYTGMKGH